MLLLLVYTWSTSSIYLVNFKAEALVFYPIVYKNSVDTPSFCASNGWLDNFLQRFNLVLRRITAKGRDLPKNIRSISLEWFAKCNEIFKKALFNRRLLMNMDETSIYIDFPSNYSYEECGVKRVKAVTAGQEKTRMSAAFTATADIIYLSNFK
jgi:hypothetical protein